MNEKTFGNKGLMLLFTTIIIQCIANFFLFLWTMVDIDFSNNLSDFHIIIILKFVLIIGNLVYSLLGYLKDNVDLNKNIIFFIYAVSLILDIFIVLGEHESSLFITILILNVFMISILFMFPGVFYEYDDNDLYGYRDSSSQINKKIFHFIPVSYYIQFFGFIFGGLYTFSIRNVYSHGDTFFYREWGLFEYAFYYEVTIGLLITISIFLTCLIKSIRVLNGKMVYEKKFYRNWNIFFMLSSLAPVIIVICLEEYEFYFDMIFLIFAALIGIIESILKIVYTNNNGLSLWFSQPPKLDPRVSTIQDKKNIPNWIQEHLSSHESISTSQISAIMNLPKKFIDDNITNWIIKKQIYGERNFTIESGNVITFDSLHACQEEFLPYTIGLYEANIEDTNSFSLFFLFHGFMPVNLRN